jgi:high-affinity iron transporter
VRRLVLIVLVALFAVPSAAFAKQNDLERARTENLTARVLVDKALQQAKTGDYTAAYETARTAYLDHYEYVEIPLRLRDPNLVFDTEDRFAQLRLALQRHDPIDEVIDRTIAVREYVNKTDRAIAKKGVAAPLVAFGFSFTILFREGIEAVLLIAILLGSLAAGQASGYRRPLAMGVGGAVLASAVTFVLATAVLDIAPVNRELLEAITALFAVVVLIGVSFWLIARIEQKRRTEFMRARVAGAIASGSAAAFMALGFTAVYREGFETVLFYKALAIIAPSLGLWIALGALVAAGALGFVAYSIIGLGRKLPLKPLLITGASVLLLMSVTFTGNAVRSLQDADVVSVHPTSGFRLPVLLAELTGIHPSREGLVAQAVLAVVLLGGAAYVFLVEPRRRRRQEERAREAVAA